MAIELRPYQSEGLTRIRATFGKCRRVLAIAPTGSGKTTCFSWLSKEWTEPTLILAHRRELIDQASDRLSDYGIEHGIIMAGVQPKPWARVQVASVATLRRRAPPPATLVICDEAHLSTAQTWEGILAHYPAAKVLGVTATPWRLGGKPLFGAYDALEVLATPQGLVDQGFLCRYTGFSYLSPDTSKLKVTAGEYNEAASEEAMREPKLVDTIIEQWLKHAAPLSTVVFATTVEHSKDLAARFVSAGVTAEHLDGTTHVNERRAILARVKSGQTRVLCNVGIAVEGLDIPRLKCCILARPTKSLTRAIQMMGRVRRPWEGVVARIHDHAFTLGEHGLPDDEREYSLSHKEVPPPVVHTCPACMAVYTTKGGCPACGEIAEPVVKARGQMVTTQDAVQVDLASMPTAVAWVTPGRVVVGTYHGYTEREAGWGKQRIHSVRGPDKMYALPGSVKLDRPLSAVPEGLLVRITYQGNTDLGGGKFRREFKVERHAHDV